MWRWMKGWMVLGVEVGDVAVQWCWWPGHGIGVMVQQVARMCKSEGGGSGVDLLTKGFDVTRISMDLRMDRSSPDTYNSYMVFSVHQRVYTANLKYSDKHNMVAFLKKPNKSVGFTEVVDFLKGTSLRYALTHNPTIYDSLVKQFWHTATVRTLANGTQQLVASIDSKEYTITKASVRSKIQLADATRIHNLSDDEIYAGLATLGGFAGDIVPLMPAMLAGAAVDQGEGSVQLAEPHHTPVDPIPSTSHSPHPSPQHSKPPHPSPQHHTSFTTTSFTISITTTFPTSFTTSTITSVFTTKTLGNAMLKLVKKVKTLETALERKSKKVLISKSEGEESEDRGRKFQDIDDNPLVSLVRESMKEKSTDFVTLTKASGE
ncbi:hypothetical protein Tco_0783619 [Tanacetum coccineum]